MRGVGGLRGIVGGAGWNDQSPMGHQSPNFKMCAVPLVPGEMQQSSPWVLRQEVLLVGGGGSSVELIALQV